MGVSKNKGTPKLFELQLFLVSETNNDFLVVLFNIQDIFLKKQLDVSENSGTPKSSILIGCSIINHPFWGTPIFGNTQVVDMPLSSIVPTAVAAHHHKCTVDTIQVEDVSGCWFP